MMQITLDEQQWDLILDILKDEPYCIVADLVKEIELQIQQAEVDEIVNAYATMATE
jgi:hypothetical protein